jgi:hypothetical protein
VRYDIRDLLRRPGGSELKTWLEHHQTVGLTNWKPKGNYSAVVSCAVSPMDKSIG